MVIFGKNLSLAAVLVTLIAVVSTIMLWNDAITNNADYGAFTYAIRFLVLVGVCISVAMVGGCAVQYYGWTKEDLESMAPKQ